MLYLYLKALHIIFVVCWMAGLFYIVRLFIYHIEARARPSTEQEILFPQYEIMEWRLWYIITTPAMVMSVLAGVGMLWANPYLLQSPWMHVKLGFVVGLLVYHFMCQKIIGQLKKGVFNWTSMQLRLWNEVATCLLVAIVFVVIFKSALNWIYGFVGFFLFIMVIMLGVKLYKLIRQKNNS